MFQHRSLTALLFVSLAVLSASAQDTDKGNLVWKFDKEKKTPFYQTMVTETTQTMKVMGTDVVQKQEQTFYFKWTPTEVKDNEVTLKQKIIGLKMKIDIGGSPITYDSTQPDNTSNPLNKFFEALKSTEFTIVLEIAKDKPIKVKSLEGEKDFVKKLTDANPQMKALLEMILSKQALQEMAEPTFACVPGKEVSKTGDSSKWSRGPITLDMGPIGKYETTYNYVYDGKDKDKLDKISVNTTLKYTPPSQAGVGGLPFKIKSATLSGADSKGEILFDSDKGRVKSVKMELNLKGDLEIEISNQSTKVTLDQKQTTTITTDDKAPTGVKE